MSKSPKPKYAKGRRVCIFCEGKNGTKISKEHVFGEWLADLFPRDERSKHTAAHITWPQGVISNKPIDSRRVQQGHSGTKKLRVVCKDCNSAWMSQLETWAKQALPPLITGQRANISPDGQKKLSTWAVKTAMVATHFQPRETSIPQHDRTALMENLTPPPGWFVWICAYKGGTWSPLTIFQDRAALSLTPIPNADSAPYYIQATTFGMGHLLVCALSSSSPTIERDFTLFEPENSFQIWPQVRSRSILWPPVEFIRDDEAYRFANILRTSGVFDHSRDRAANWTFTF